MFTNNDSPQELELCCYKSVLLDKPERRRRTARVQIPELDHVTLHVTMGIRSKVVASSSLRSMAGFSAVVLFYFLAEWMLTNSHQKPFQSSLEPLPCGSLLIMLSKS